MSRRYPSRRRSRTKSRHPFVAFLLVASFGILFAGCLGPEDVQEESFSFTEDDLAQYRGLADEVDGSGATVPFIEPLESGSGAMEDVDTITLDLSQVDTYSALRGGVGGGQNTFQVTNTFLNVRGAPSTSAEIVESLDFGESMEVLEFLNNTWAKVKLSSGVEGYVAHRYIARTTSEERLEEEKAKYDNMYYVSFAFVNIRKEADQSSEKVGEIPGQTMVEPVSIEGDWAKVSYEGVDGYVSASYLAKFEPTFVVRQDTYNLPILEYRLVAGQEEEMLTALVDHVAAVRAAGYSPMSFNDFYTLLLAQQRRDVRLDPKKFMVAVSGITPENVKQVSDALAGRGIRPTLFIETQYIGLSGITEKTLLTLMANGFDIQSGAHTGDDLRSLTNAQVELEMKQSRKILEDYTKKTVYAVAYPQGGANDRVAGIAAEAGYLFGLADGGDASFMRNELLRIPGLRVFSSMSDDDITEFVTGS